MYWFQLLKAVSIYIEYLIWVIKWSIVFENVYCRGINIHIDRIGLYDGSETK